MLGEFESKPALALNKMFEIELLILSFFQYDRLKQRLNAGNGDRLETQTIPYI